MTGHEHFLVVAECSDRYDNRSLTTRRAPMSFKRFTEDLAGYPEFGLVTVEKSREWSNAIKVSGDAIGKGSLDRLTEIGRRHGFVVLADRIMVWESEEDYERYGKSSYPDTQHGDTGGNVVNLREWKSRNR